MEMELLKNKSKTNKQDRKPRNHNNFMQMNETYCCIGLLWQIFVAKTQTLECMMRLVVPMRCWHWSQSHLRATVVHLVAVPTF